ncbi:hypothetical protein MPSEU_000195500 [Mayamaea pseudoterrestris]|nr:hypothetical protein MPSEU_000195500 [Mayamaea pseudoterrestris]
MATANHSPRRAIRWQSTQSLGFASKTDRWTLPQLPMAISPRKQCAKKRALRKKEKLHSCPSFHLDVNPTMPVRDTSEEFMPDAPTVHSKRRVRFAMYEKSNLRHTPVEKIFSYPAVPPEHAADCFWSRQETRNFRSFQKDVARYYKNTTGDAIAQSIRFLHDPTLKNESTLKSLALTDAKAIETLTECNTRGLEHFICDFFIKHRSLATRKVLAIQESCRDKDPEQLSCLLRICSLTDSAASTRYAFMVAKGDEALAMINTSAAPSSSNAKAHARAPVRTGSLQGSRYAVCA